MSAEQNIETAKAGYAAFLRGDVPAIIGLLGEDIEWITPVLPGVPGSGVKKGHAGVLQFFQSVGETWEFEAFEPRDFIANDDMLAVRGYYRVKARKTGKPAESEWVMVWRFRNGKCIQFQEFNDTAKLIQAVS